MVLSNFHLHSDPGDNVAFSDFLFDNQAFADAMYGSMNEEGVFTAQTGQASTLDDANQMNSRDKFTVIFQEHLKEAGYETIVSYEDAHGNFNGVWSFFCAFASLSSKLRWYANEAEVNLAIKKRMIKTTQGESPLVYFDGATMQIYQFPSRSEEVVFCRTFPDAFGCNIVHRIDPTKLDITAANLEIKPSGAVDVELGVFTKVDIPKNSYVSMKDQTNDIYFPPSTYELIQNFTKHPAGSDYAFLDEFLSSYGFGHHYFVSFSSLRLFSL